MNILDSKEEKCEIINNLKSEIFVFILIFWNSKIHEYIKTLYIHYLYLNTPKQTVLLTNSGNKLCITAIKTCIYLHVKSVHFPFDRNQTAIFIVN